MSVLLTVMSSMFLQAAVEVPDMNRFELPPVRAGIEYRYEIPVDGGLAPLHWSLRGDVPPGLKLDAEKGHLAGVIVRPKAEPYLFDVEVADSSQPPQRFRIGYSLMVKPTPLRIRPPSASRLRIEPPAPNPVLPGNGLAAVAALAAPPVSSPPATVSAPVPSPSPAIVSPAAASPAAAPQTVVHAPVAEPIPEATALSSGDRRTMPVSHIRLVAQDRDSTELDFEVVDDPRHGSVTIRYPKPQRKFAYAYYTANTGYTGKDTFRYKAIDKDKNASEPATVTIDVKRAGLKWEIIGGASTGLSSEEGGDVPDVDGKSLPDFLFRLDWLIQHPATSDKEDGASLVHLDSGQLAVQMDEKDRTAQWSSHFAFDVGFVNRPISVMKQGEDAEMMLTYQRAFTSNGAFSYNWVKNADEFGTHAESGAIVRAGMDVFIDEDDITTNDDGVTFVRLRNDDKSAFFRFEAGARFALKQYDENSNTVFIRKADNTKATDLVNLPGSDMKGQVRYPRNLVDLLVLEAVYQRSDAMKGLASVPGEESINRLAVRFFAFPRLPNAPKGYKFLIGAEINRDFHGGPQDVRIFYGFNVLPSELF